MPPSGGNPEIISFGRAPNPSPLPNLPCLFPVPNVPTINRFDGMIQAINNSIPSLGGTPNILSMGFDGANGIIDMAGTNNQGGPGLLINYYCGKDIFMNTGTNGGNVTMTSATKGMVGIGTDAPTAKLDVFGSLRLRNGSEGANKVLVSDADGVASWLDPSTIEDGKWTLNGTDVYRLTGNVGIGTTDAYKMLTVNGDVSLANYNNSGGGNMGNGMSGLEILGMNQIPTRRGISLESDPNGSFNFFINANQTTSSFNFKNGNGTPTTLMTIMGNGNVGIGITTPTNKLEVCGTIRSKEWIVETSWCDFKFEDTYIRMNWVEKQNYIRKYKHLPELDSGIDIELNGLYVAKTLRGFIWNIEDNTLDIIELSKENQLQKEKLILIEGAYSNLKQHYDELEKRLISIETKN